MRARDPRAGSSVTGSACLRTLLSLIAGALIGCAGTAPPSIVLVTLDTLRRDHVGAYGGPAGLTEALDAFAARALVHDAAFTTMPTTGPAHVSLFTGLLPSEHGVLRNGEHLSAEHRDAELARQLGRAGYATAAFVTSKMAGPGATGLAGFEVYDVPVGALRSGGEAVERALAWLDAEPRRPVFLWVHLYDAHAPYGGTDEKRGNVPLPRNTYGWVSRARYADETARREMDERYARGVRSADAAFGELLRGVGERLPQPPFVIVASDHGETLGDRLRERSYAYDHGEFLDREDVEIVLMLAGPGIEPGRSSGTASIRDLYGTLRAIAGIAEPGSEARDLRVADAAPRAVVIQRRRYAGKRPALVRSHAAAACDGRHLVIVGDDGTPTRVPAGAPRALLQLARSHLPGAGPAPAPHVDPQTREALRSLGYGE